MKDISSCKAQLRCEISCWQDVVRAKNLHGLQSKPKCMSGWKKSPVKTVKYNDSASDGGGSGAINLQRLGKCPE